MLKSVDAIDKAIRYGVILLLTAMLTACGNAPARQVAELAPLDLNASDWPAVAAEFATVRESNLHQRAGRFSRSIPATVRWRLWRNIDRIVSERPQLGLGELWQKDGQTLFHSTLYHADRTAVEFRQDDLDILGQSPSWQKLSMLVDPALLRQLKAGGLEMSGEGYPLQEFRGIVDGTTWRVVMRMDFKLPELIERTQGDFCERTRLLQAYPFAQAPWQPSAVEGYRRIDFSDLGDMESDPFVIKIQAQMGHEHP